MNKLHLLSTKRVLQSLLTLTFMILVASPTFAQEKKTRKIDKQELALRQAKGKIFKGIVTDQKDALPGANISLKGTNRGTNTDFDGNFEFPLRLIDGDVLVFEYVGFKTKEVTIGPATQFIRVKLEEDTEILELIVLDEHQTKKLHKTKKSAFKKKKKGNEKENR